MTNDRKILILCGAGHFVAHFYMLLFPSLALWIRDDFKLTTAETLNLGFTMYLLFGVMALPFGYLGDRIRAKTLLLAMFMSVGAPPLPAL